MARPRLRLSLRAWSERNLMVTEGPAVASGGGAVRWTPARFPLATAWLDAVDSAAWSDVIVVGSPQTAKTLMNVVAVVLYYLFEQRRPCLYMNASLNNASDVWATKIRPAIEAVPELAAQIPESRDDQGKRERRDFTNGVSLFLAGAESVGGLSSRTIPVGVYDDVQAMPDRLGEFGHPCDVARTRQASFPERLRTTVILGTAGSVEQYHWRALQKSALFRPYVPCPDCGTMQLISWSRMQFDAKDAIAARDDCWLRCANEACERRIHDSDLQAMLRGAQWVSTGGLADPPESVDLADTTDAGPAVFPRSRVPTRAAGFWYTTLYWPWVSWGALAARWVESRGDPDAERDFDQHVLVKATEPPRVDLDAPEPADFATHADDSYKSGTLPAGVDVVTITGDVHDRFIYYVVRGWRRADGESWLIDANTIGVHGPHKNAALKKEEHKAAVMHGVTRALNDLWEMEACGWPSLGSGVVTNATLVLIDGGYLTDTVGRFCEQRGNRKWRMTLGRTVKQSTLRIWDDVPAKDKRGRMYWALGTDQAKHRLRELYKIPPGHAGHWHTYSDRDLSAYYRHLASEHWIDEDRKWVKRNDGSGPNHWLDCEASQIAAAVACGVRLMGDQPRVKVVSSWTERRVDMRRNAR